MIAPGPASSGIASGKTEMSSAPPTVAELVRRARAALGAALEHHLERDQQQHHAARDPERRQADAEHAEQAIADEREAEQDQARDQGPLERHPAPLGRRPCPRVSASSTGTSPSGSMTTNSVVKRVQDDVEHGP